jgi:hypothetical protein
MYKKIPMNIPFAEILKPESAIPKIPYSDRIKIEPGYALKEFLGDFWESVKDLLSSHYGLNMQPEYARSD